MVPFFDSVVGFRKYLNNNLGVQFEPWPIFALGMAILFMSFVFMPKVVLMALSIALFLAPVWLPFMLGGGAWKLWYVWRRSDFIAKQAYVLLEIKPPRNLAKTPLAMEAFLSAIHLTGGESTWYARFTGGIRPSYSLEIASFEGKVHFFIYTRANYRRLVESQLYAQYPGIQITEAPDYTRTISADPEEWIVWGCDFKHTGENPLPIKTYVEYKLDTVQKEYEQVDPMAQLIEYMGSIGKGEYIWLQFVIRAHRGERYGATPGAIASYRKSKRGKPYTWVDEGEEMVEAIRKEIRQAYLDPVTGKEVPGFPNPTKGQAEKIAAIERNTLKLGFDVGTRAIYIADSKHFNPIAITHMVGLFKPFTTTGWNGINSTNWMKKFDDYPWEMGVERRKNYFRRRLVEAYRRRQFFYDPIFWGGLMPDETMIMSTEELATLFHVPSQSVATPGLGRVHSATSEAPPNLPV